jgi:hypothetical protein
MKKLLLISILILTGLRVFAQNAVIEHVTGTVEIKQPGENSYKNAVSGQEIFKETVISTGFKSFAIIKIGSATITVRPITHLSLTEIQKEAEAELINVNLRAGSVRVNVKPPTGTKASAAITGPMAVASVRGTSFEFDIHNLYVIEGAVSFAGNRGQNIIVRAGETSRIDQSGMVTIPKDEKISNLMPPSPAGTSERDTPASGAASRNVFTSINIEFK